MKAVAAAAAVAAAYVCCSWCKEKKNLNSKLSAIILACCLICCCYCCCCRHCCQWLSFKLLPPITLYTQQFFHYYFSHNFFSLESMYTYLLAPFDFCTFLAFLHVFSCRSSPYHFFFFFFFAIFTCRYWQQSAATNICRIACFFSTFLVASLPRLQVLSSVLVNFSYFAGFALAWISNFQYLRAYSVQHVIWGFHISYISTVFL